VDLDLVAGADGRLGPKSALVSVSIASKSEDVWATIEAAPGAVARQEHGATVR